MPDEERSGGGVRSHCRHAPTTTDETVRPTPAATATCWRAVSIRQSSSAQRPRSEDGQQLTPIEVKWTERPSSTDCRHLRTFLDENRESAPRGLVVCRVPPPLQLDERITAIPWWAL